MESFDFRSDFTFAKLARIAQFEKRCHDANCNTETFDTKSVTYDERIYYASKPIITIDDDYKINEKGRVFANN
ncbi:unnamed protein product [Lasius platythorax]|uniref:Uncharacterized protein n=1 Tax=Lasius platythorax TaxID=488582 RepID=A0AAV2NS54_9HYME